MRSFSFSIYADLCSLFRQRSRQRKSSGFQRIQIPLLPRSPEIAYGGHSYVEGEFLIKPIANVTTAITRMTAPA
jgi:hypothetical protein